MGCLYIRPHHHLSSYPWNSSLNILQIIFQNRKMWLLQRGDQLLHCSKKEALIARGKKEWSGVFHGQKRGRRLSAYQLFRTRGSLECVAFGFRHNVAAGSGDLITAFLTLGSGTGFTDWSHISSAKFECVVNIYLAGWHTVVLEIMG